MIFMTYTIVVSFVWELSMLSQSSRGLNACIASVSLWKCSAPSWQDPRWPLPHFWPSAPTKISCSSLISTTKCQGDLGIFTQFAYTLCLRWIINSRGTSWAQVQGDSEGETDTSLHFIHINIEDTRVMYALLGKAYSEAAHTSYAGLADLTDWPSLKKWMRVDLRSLRLFQWSLHNETVCTKLAAFCIVVQTMPLEPNCSHGTVLEFLQEHFSAGYPCLELLWACNPWFVVFRLKPTCRPQVSS